MTRLLKKVLLLLDISVMQIRAGFRSINHLSQKVKSVAGLTNKKHIFLDSVTKIKRENTRKSRKKTL